MKYATKNVTIEAMEIKEIGDIDGQGNHCFHFSDRNYAIVPPAQCGAHTPAVGDFYIMRDDGDNYLCPAKAFNEKYQPISEAGDLKKSSLQLGDDQAAAVQKSPNRVTLASIEDKVVTVEYVNPATAPEFTVAIMRLQNGYAVLGQSACADPANFNEELGRKFAREDALRKVWALEGYLLRQRLAMPEPALMHSDKLSDDLKEAIDGRG
jgi:hypothetical protein